ncbi:MAG: hypothetical protein ACI4ED_03615 [Suilimivivens sp.]
MEKILQVTSSFPTMNGTQILLTVAAVTGYRLCGEKIYRNWTQG